MMGGFLDVDVMVLGSWRAEGEEGYGEIMIWSVSLWKNRRVRTH